MGKICKTDSLIDTEFRVVWLILFKMASVAPWLVIPTVGWCQGVHKIESKTFEVDRNMYDSMHAMQMVGKES